MVDQPEEQHDSYAWEIDDPDNPVSESTQKSDSSQKKKEYQKKSGGDEEEGLKVQQRRERSTIDGEKKKIEPTRYELWLAEKRKHAGIEVKCPNCGAINIDLPFVVGEKCTQCGFDMEKGENIERKMREFDIQGGRQQQARVTPISPSVIRLSLDLPDFLINDPESLFQWDYQSQSYVPYLVVAIFSLVLILIYSGMMISKAEFDNYQSGMMIFFLIVAIFSVYGLSMSLMVTRIELNEISVKFVGSGRTVEIPWDRIYSITNDRALNGKARIASFLYPSSWRYTFLGSRWFLNSYSSWSDFGGFEPFDTSSISPYYTNHIIVKGGYQSVDWYFSGGRDKGFIRALAIIIYMARLKNTECFVDIDSLKASDKVIKMVL